MRGDVPGQPGVFSYVMPEQRVPQDHPLRAIGAMVDKVLHDLSPAFDRLYSRVGRPSIPPEHLLRALLLQVLYTIRSERQLMEQLDYNLLYRWFVGLNMDAPIWDATTFTKNRQRLLDGDIAQAFFERVLAQARERQLLSAEHFTVDATLLESWAGLQSFRAKAQDPSDPPPPDDPGNPTVNFHGERRTNATHQSTTDPDARLFRTGHGREAKLSYMGHVVMENRNGLVVGAQVTTATGTAEAHTAEDLVEQVVGERERRCTVGADKAFDTRDFVDAMRDLNVTPHIAQSTTGRHSAIDARTTRHPGYEISQRTRKRVEEVFGWLKTVALMRKLRHCGTERVDWMFVFACAVYNLVRLRNLQEAVA
jgi:transposase